MTMMLNDAFMTDVDADDMGNEVGSQEASRCCEHSYEAYKGGQVPQDVVEPIVVRELQEKVAEKNKENRAHDHVRHALGTKPLACYYEEERKRKGEEFTILGSYLSAHQKKNGEYPTDFTQEKS
ncbi:hypothetical protein H6P81_006993 [Aristolochia fimbriata]|uniref:Uncharacterized protein n=1 Tax=Aristolochia fimbriata TaxID=158543 RepID=A0AAV7F077_ARIFI|nr:hypothetical protein H6P81_006993 [Aristolochia fimbriata]